MQNEEIGIINEVGLHHWENNGKWHILRGYELEIFVVFWILCKIFYIFGIPIQQIVFFHSVFSFSIQNIKFSFHFLIFFVIIRQFSIFFS